MPARGGGVEVKKLQFPAEFGSLGWLKDRRDGPIGTDARALFTTLLCTLAKYGYHGVRYRFHGRPGSVARRGMDTRQAQHFRHILRQAQHFRKLRDTIRGRRSTWAKRSTFPRSGIEFVAGAALSQGER